ncbi:hypothetical protein M406DRAFT_286089, partial [Cryphonectria parasitica EP155]
MSARPSEAKSLQHPDTRAAGSMQSRIHAGRTSESLSAGPATDALHDFNLRNSRTVAMNATLEPPRSPSGPDALPSSLTAAFLSYSPQRYDSSHDQSMSVSPPTPIVNLPPGDSTPQRVDSGYEEHHDHYKSPSFRPSNPLQIPTDSLYIQHSALSPIADGSHTTLNADGLQDSHRSSNLPLSRKSSAPSLKPLSRTPSIKSAAFGLGFGSAASSRVPSPIITAMGDVTPLPSPLLSGDSPGPWKRLHGRPPSRDASSQQLPTIMSESVLVTSNGESIASAVANQSKRKSLAKPSDAPGEDS